MQDTIKKISSTQTNISFLQPSPELLEYQDLMPIKAEDREALKADIEKSGFIRDAIKVYQDASGEYFIIGGLNRWEIAKELNIDIVPIDVYSGTTGQVKELVIDDNLNRRHLSKASKKELEKAKREQIKINLVLRPEKSNRSIARDLDVDHKTVGKVRANLEEQGEIEKVDKIVTTGGFERSAKNKTPKPKKVEKIPEEKMPKAISKKIVRCPHCQEEFEI